MGGSIIKRNARRLKISDGVQELLYVDDIRFLLPTSNICERRFLVQDLL